MACLHGMRARAGRADHGVQSAQPPQAGALERPHDARAAAALARRTAPGGKRRRELAGGAAARRVPAAGGRRLARRFGQNAVVAAAPRPAAAPADPGLSGMRERCHGTALHQALLASDERHRSAGGAVRARRSWCRMACDPLALTRWQRAQLQPTQTEPALPPARDPAGRRPGRCRKPTVVVPARLWPGMAGQSRKPIQPFGAVVRPMQPVRETLASRVCAPGEPVALEHEAVLRRLDGRAIALVAERYLPGA